MASCCSRRGRKSLVPAIAIVSVICTVPGCDRIPTAGELKDKITGEEKPASQPTAPVDRAPAAPAATPTPDQTPPGRRTRSVAAPTRPAPRSPAEVIAAFRNKRPRERTDADLARLAALESGLEQLTELDLSGASITVEGFRHVEKLVHVVDLSVRRFRLPAPAFAPVAKLVNLERFVADESTFSDSAAQFLAGLSSLKELSLNGTLVTDYAFEQFGGLTSLETIRLTRTSITGAGFQVFGRSRTGLKRIAVQQTEFGRHGMRNIRGSNTLEFLGLDHARINDGNLIALRGMKNLKDLSLSDNSITDLGMKQVIGGLKQLVYLNLKGNRAISNRGIGFLKDTSIHGRTGRKY